mgnify:FL=1
MGCMTSSKIKGISKLGPAETPLSLPVILSIIGGQTMVKLTIQRRRPFCYCAMGVGVMVPDITSLSKTYSNWRMTWALRFALPIIHRIPPSTTRLNIDCFPISQGYVQASILTRLNTLGTSWQQRLPRQDSKSSPPLLMLFMRLGEKLLRNSLSRCPFCLTTTYHGGIM